MFVFLVLGFSAGGDVVTLTVGVTQPLSGKTTRTLKDAGVPTPVYWVSPQLYWMSTHM